MKRAMFLIVSAFLAVTTFATNASKVTLAKISGKNTISVSQQDQNLILEPSIDYGHGVTQHISHASHASHGSHSSHASHSSHVSHFSGM